MKTVVITGASMGIGLELAKLYTQNGFLVICLSRSVPAESFENFKHVPCDVSQLESVQNAFKQISEMTTSVDVLINNAGVGTGGSIEHTDPMDAKKAIDTNLLGVVYVTSIFLGKLRESQGNIINVSSVGGQFALPYQTLYSATKAAVISFSNGLRNELRPFKVRVMTILPGDANTRFSRIKNNDDGVYQSYSDKSISGMEKDERNGMSSQHVARKIFKYQRRRRMPQQKVIGVKYAFLMFISRFLPTRFVNYLVFKLYGGAGKARTK